jgi:hypothetical protein
MNKTKQTLKYISLDFFAGFISWLFFYYFRRNYIDPEHFNKLEKIYYDINLLWGLAVIPLFWILLHYLSGYYKNIYRKSRLSELFQTFGVSVIGVVIIFFSLLLDDYVESYRYYYKSFFVLLGLHFFYYIFF